MSTCVLVPEPAEEAVKISAGVAAGHPATVQAGLEMLDEGGSAADAAVAAVLASCVAETVLTGLAGGGFATYYDAGTRSVTCLDFFVSIPGLDGDGPAGPMNAVEVSFGGVPLMYSIGAPSAGVPGVPAGCGEVHQRWGRLPWQAIVRPAVELARAGVALPTAQARALAYCAPAMLPGDGARVYAPDGRLLTGGDRVYVPGLDQALMAIADEGPDVFYTGWLGERLIRAIRAGGGELGPTDLAAYQVLELPVEHVQFAGTTVHARRDLNDTIGALGALPDLRGSSRAERAVAIAGVLRDPSGHRVGDTTNVSIVDADGNACVVTTTLGLGAGVWLPGLGVHLNSMLGEGELRTPDLAPGRRMASMMCPLVVTRGADLVLAAGSAGASRIRTALVHTLAGVLADNRTVAEAVAAPRFHVAGETVHTEPDVRTDERIALAAAGYHVNRWAESDHYFGGVSAVGVSGAAGDPRRGGMGRTAAVAASPAL